jgi:hypothetical protein
MHNKLKEKIDTVCQTANEKAERTKSRLKVPLSERITLLSPIYTSMHIPQISVEIGESEDFSNHRH